MFEEVIQRVQPTVLQVLGHTFDDLTVRFLLVCETFFRRPLLVLLFKVKRRPSNVAQIDSTFIQDDLSFTFDVKVRVDPLIEEVVLEL